MREGRDFRYQMWATGTRELDVPHALPAHLCNPSLPRPHFSQNDPPMLEALVLPAQALVVLVGAEYLCAEESVTFGLERAVVDRFRFLDLAEGPGFGSCPETPVRCEWRRMISNLTLGSEKIQKVFHGFSRVVFEGVGTENLISIVVALDVSVPSVHPSSPVF